MLGSGMIGRRLSALFLLFALLGGGFGLPLADSVIYHWNPTPGSEVQSPEIGLDSPAGPFHLLGCALCLSALSGSGLQASSPAIQPAFATASVDRHTPPLQRPTHTDLSLGLSRAPPLV